MTLPTLSLLVYLALLSLLLGWLALLIFFAAPLAARWREPVFRHPLLILESDDWGAGPLEQAAVLTRITQMLSGFRDVQGRVPVMTLGIILEVPNTERIARENGIAYHALTLQDAIFTEVRASIQRGVERGIFIPQLHGQAHYWPSALMAAATQDEAVHRWLVTPGLPHTEALPSSLQSRWVDASCLPSRSLDSQQIDEAVADETAHYQACLGDLPAVAVATTFIWTEAVEQAWRRAGVDTIITPGHRATARDGAGRPAAVDLTMLTGDRSRAGQIYLVRDVYFEPTLGHPPQRLLDGLSARTRQGRACLVEIHRFNFLQAADASLASLHSAMALCLAQFPSLRFISPRELARAIEHTDATLVEREFRSRVLAWLNRLPDIPRFHRLARWSGLMLLLTLLGRAA